MKGTKQAIEHDNNALQLLPFTVGVAQNIQKLIDCCVYSVSTTTKT